MKWHDNLDFSSEAGDLFHKLEVKEISRESVSCKPCFAICCTTPIITPLSSSSTPSSQSFLSFHHISQAKPSSHTLYFSDGSRRIDMILVYEVCTKRVFSCLLTYLGINDRLFNVKYSCKIFCPYRLTRRTQRRLMQGSLLKSTSNYKALRPKLKANL